MLEPKIVQLLKQIVHKYLPDDSYKTFIFGSRASGKNRKFSDIDLGINGPKPLTPKEYVRIQGALEESDLPYHVDLVDFNKDMNEKIKLKELKLALSRLKDGVSVVENDLDRDGVIQRFEFTFELVWKAIQEFARINGLEVVSPRDSFRVAADLKLIENPEDWFVFLKDRNETTHLYSEDQAKEIFSHIPDFIKKVEALIIKLQ